jgi:ABC-2 type transport system permease protein
MIILYGLYQITMGEGLQPHQLTDLLLGTVLYLLGAFAYLNLSILMELLALWADNVWSLSVILRFFSFFLGGGLVPLVFFPAWASATIAWTPFPYMISVPVRTIMGLTTLSEIIAASVLLIVWAWIFYRGAVLVWRRGQYRYTGVGI